MDSQEQDLYVEEAAKLWVILSRESEKTQQEMFVAMYSRATSSLAGANKLLQARDIENAELKFQLAACKDSLVDVQDEKTDLQDRVDVLTKVVGEVVNLQNLLLCNSLTAEEFSRKFWDILKQHQLDDDDLEDVLATPREDLLPKNSKL